MARMDLERRTRWEVVSGLGKTWGDFPEGIVPAIHEAMARVEGAELVYEDSDSIGNECDLIYHIAPEGVTCHISLGTAVDRTLYGREGVMRITANKIRTAFGR